MSNFLNLMFIIIIPCYIWDWYDFIILGDRSIFVYIGLICLSLYLIGEIPNRIQLYKEFKTIWYNDNNINL